MCVSQHLLSLCDELFEEISPLEMSSNAALALETSDVCEFLAEQTESGGDEDEAEIIADTQSRLHKIWSLITPGEKCKNLSLSTRFNELQEHLEYLLEESCPLPGDEDPSWKDEYLFGNEDDDFYDEDQDVFCEEDVC